MFRFLVVNMIKLLANALLVTILLCFILVSHGYPFQVDAEEDTVTSPSTNGYTEVPSTAGDWEPRLIYEWKKRGNDRIRKKQCNGGRPGDWLSC